MTDTFDPLDFEFDEPFQISPPPAKKKKKLIGLDDLLKDYEEQKKLEERKSKQKKIQKAFDAEDKFDDATEARLSECVDKCHKEINQINGDEEIALWGIQAFGDQENLPLLEYPELKSSILLRSFLKHEISTLVELNMEEVESFFEGLLLDGWLLHLVSASGCVEKSIAAWTFNLMLHSSNTGLMEAACEFWCAILSLKDKRADTSSMKIDWLPRYSDLKRALQAYGFILDSPSKLSSDIDMVGDGPPQNIRSWIKCAASLCQLRSQRIFSTQEAEELLVIIISLFLDRQLLGLSLILCEAMLSAINFFRDEQWPDSCEKVAKSIAYRVPCDINCLRVVESVGRVDTRSKQLQSAAAFQFLVTCLDATVTDAEEILRLLVSINIRDKKCDLLKMYIYLSLAENWLSSEPSLKDNAVIRELWGTCLRNCSSCITITDLRSYASNVRCKASYLLQASTSK